MIHEDFCNIIMGLAGGSHRQENRERRIRKNNTEQVGKIFGKQGRVIVSVGMSKNSLNVRFSH